MPLLEESKILRTRALVEMLNHSSENRLEPDVMLKLGDDMLPVHSPFLAQMSEYFKAKFQVSSQYAAESFAVPGMNIQRKDKKVLLTSNLLQKISSKVKGRIISLTSDYPEVACVQGQLNTAAHCT